MKKLFKHLNAETSPLKWIYNHTRGYYILFYLVTALMFIALAWYTHASPPIYDQYFWFGRDFWAVVFLGEAGLMAFMAGASLRAVGRTGRTYRARQIATFTAASAIMLRGINVWLLPGSTILSLVVPAWAAFILLWVGPLLWNLPATIQEYKRLRDRVDTLDRRLEKLPDDK